MAKFLVELKNISKSFPGVKALDEVSFDLKEGEVHALIGENGAGKSTLMKIMSGIFHRDSGDFFVNGNNIKTMSLKKAEELGIAIIHQELNMCNHLTVAENMFLGREDSKFNFIMQRKMNEKAKEYLSKLKLDIDPKTVVGNLPVAKQQMVEIAKALSVNAKVLIMDEPTSSLTDRETKELFSIVRELRDNGCGIIYISHRLEELEEITDRITILRDGQYIDTMNYKDTNLDEIISLMVGREIKEKFPRIKRKKGEKILKVENLSAGMVSDVSFDLYKGEILGISGLMGAGRTELLRALFGVDHIDSGNIYLYDKKVKVKNPLDAIKSGIVLTPEDRKKEGLCIKHSIKENIGLANLDTVCNKLGIINDKKEMELTKTAIEKLKIKTSSPKVDVKNLSGGNQQKVVVGKWMVRDAKVVLFDEPTRGIDVAAKIEIYNLMNELKNNGIGVLFVSSEMPEIIGMSDRILVMCDGKITGELNIEDATQDKIMSYATQFANIKKSV